MWNISYEKPVNPKWKDLSGQKFGRLKVESFDCIKRKYKQSHSYWNCVCECGNTVTVKSSHLLNSHTNSCGCYHKEKTTKHGLSNHPVYQRAKDEVRRCHNPNHEYYKDYGGRGITVCEPWRNDLGLMTKDILRLIGEPPTNYHQLDRPNNNKSYQPDNICWKTPEENQRNKRNTHNHSSAPINKKQTPTYNSWSGLIKNHYSEVCIEWRYDGNPDTDNGFKNFLKDMGIKPRKRSPIKRHDESKPFCKDNCFWD